MKKKYKHIHFVLSNCFLRMKDDRLWEIVDNKTGDLIGYIEYSSQWKDYALRTTMLSAMTFNSLCLLDIVDFIKQLKTEVE